MSYDSAEYIETVSLDIVNPDSRKNHSIVFLTKDIR